jgi:acyl carrier protein
MDDKQIRLAGCFLAVFPELSTDRITESSSISVKNWDSVAGVTLLAVVEEEFGITIEANDLARFNSFNGFLKYLEEIESCGQNSYDRHS